MNKILITGGHLTPALAVLDELQKLESTQILWVGYKTNQAGNKELSAEYKVITERKIPFFSLKSGKLVRKWTPQTFLYGIWQFALLFLGLFQALIIVLRVRPNLVLSFGGFMAVPVVVWAKLFGAKIVTHEQTVVVGLANKIITKFADKILVSWEDSLKYFPKTKTILSGNPIRKEILNPPHSSTLFNSFYKKLPVVFITGGNQGANEINSRIELILSELLEISNVVHQCGSREIKRFASKKNELSIDQQKKYLVSDYFNSTDIAYIFNNADLVISRSGANTITELLFLKKRCILIPIPWVSHNEQFKNAKLLESNGLATIFEQKDENTAFKLLEVVKSNLEFKSHKEKKDTDLIHVNAASKIAKIAQELLDE